VADDFLHAVRRHFAFLVDEHAFRVGDESRHAVRLESPTLVVDAVLDPLGELEVRLRRRGDDDAHGVWTYAGMVGSASLDRVLEIAGQELRAQDALLRGDPAAFEHLAAEQRQRAEAWTAFYAGTGPRPRTGKLP
jgi:hypothetical protein